LVVEAFVVLAFEVAKLDVVPHNVPIIAWVICAKIAASPVVVVVAKTAKFVFVALVIVPFVALMFARFRFPAERLVIVALVKVASVPTRFVVLVVEALVVDE